jgi:hypothetical protein
MRVLAPKSLSRKVFSSKRSREPRREKCQNHPVGHGLEKTRLRSGSCSVSVLQLVQSLV